MEIKLEHIEAKLNKIESKINSYDDRIDEMEQYSRSNCLILHGTDIDTDLAYCEFLNEVTILFNDMLSLDQEVESEDIDIAHPLPKNKKNEHSIIVKFVQRSLRNNIYEKKSKLTGSGISITESLTKRRLQILKHAQNTFGFKNAWFNNGKFFRSNRGKRHWIKNMSDVDDLQ